MAAARTVEVVTARLGFGFGFGLELGLGLARTVELVTARQLRERISLCEIPKADAALDGLRHRLSRLVGFGVRVWR